MNPPTRLELHDVQELRRAFDQSFALPPSSETEGLLPLIAIRAGGEALVLRASQITGIARRRRIVPVASGVAELMGITGMRGMVVPVFSLAGLLGTRRPHDESGWLALAHRESPVALAFDEFEEQCEVKRTCLYDATDAGRRHIREMAQIGSSVRAVIDVPSVVEAIRRAAEPSRR